MLVLCSLGMCTESQMQLSLLDNFPVSGSSALHNPVQRLVGLQGMALRDQFYPHRVDAGVHLKWLMGFQRL